MSRRSAQKKCCIFFTTCASRSEARKISRALLEAKLVACTNILAPVESSFWWQGKIDKSLEVLLIGKTAQAKFSAVEKMVRAKHSYSVPEIVSVAISAGSGAYLRWIRESVA